MRAVYECRDNKFLTLSMDEVVPVFSSDFVDPDGIPVTCAVRTNRPQLQFVKGTLTVTDPEVIKGMRAYIKRRRDEFITEISFEGNEADLEDPEEIIPAAPEVRPKQYDIGLDWEKLSDFDRDMVRRMSR